MRYITTLASLMLLAVACGALGDPPPVELTVRDSLLGAGKIVQIKNTSNKPLEALELQIESPTGEQRSYASDELGPYGELEVGWKKLGGWEIPPGARVKLRCKGFVRAIEVTVPASDTADHGGS